MIPPTKILVIGDLHLKHIKYFPEYIDAQIDTIERIIAKEKPTQTILLGDVFHKRSPSPTVLIKFRDFLAYHMHIDIVVGNHDFETKSDNGLTALSLFNSLASDIRIHNHHFLDSYNFSKPVWFIPHYENEETIKTILAGCETGHVIFGHFGFDGCLNSIGNLDFSIDPNSIKSTTFLGHIHKYRKRKNVTIVGTPYSTSFGESKKENFYLMLDQNFRAKKRKVLYGIRHLVFNYSELEENAKKINDKRYFTLLRVLVDEIDSANTLSLQEDIESKYNVQYVDIKFKAVIKARDEISEFYPKKEITQVSDILLKEYVKENITSLSEEDIWSGFEELKNADSKD